MRVAIVGCSRLKLDRPARAEELYTSPLFRKSAELARALSTRRWFVLSAKHGLVWHDDVIDPYDQTLATMTPAERRVWRDRVRWHVNLFIPAEAELVVLAGEQYVRPLRGGGREISEPLAGLFIGQRLRKLNAMLASIADAELQAVSE